MISLNSQGFTKREKFNMLANAGMSSIAINFLSTNCFFFFINHIRLALNISMFMLL